MNVLQRALNRIREAIIPTVHAPTIPPRQEMREVPSPFPGSRTPIKIPTNLQWGQGNIGLVDRVGLAAHQLGRDARLGWDTPGGLLGKGGILGGADDVLGATPQFTQGTARMADTHLPPPSQPATITPEVRRTPIPPTPALPGDFQTRLATLPIIPTAAVGDFRTQAPAPIGPATRAPIMTPGTAPTPAMTPPAPFMMGGGGDRSAIIGGGINIPMETPLPPTRVLPGDLGGQAPLGQFDAMIRALQMQQGGQGRFVQMPTVGESPFGPAGAQERAIRRLRERELQRAF